MELHVLSAIRRDHGVRLGEVRKAVDYLRRRFKSRHPLADEQMQTDGTNLFVERYGELVDASDQGQMAMKVCLSSYLDRIERDARAPRSGSIPSRLAARSPIGGPSSSILGCSSVAPVSPERACRRP